METSAERELIPTTGLDSEPATATGFCPLLLVIGFEKSDHYPICHSDLYA